MDIPVRLVLSRSTYPLKPTAQDTWASFASTQSVLQREAHMLITITLKRRLRMKCASNLQTCLSLSPAVPTRQTPLQYLVKVFRIILRGDGQVMSHFRLQLHHLKGSTSVSFHSGLLAIT